MLGSRAMRRGMARLATGLLPLRSYAPLPPRRAPLASLAEATLPRFQLATKLLQLQPKRRVLALELLDPFLGSHNRVVPEIDAFEQRSIDDSRKSISPSEH